MEYRCVCKDCKKEFKSTKEVDLDGFGRCEKDNAEYQKKIQYHETQVRKRGASIRAPSRASDHYEDIRRDYDKERMKNSKTIF